MIFERLRLIDDEIPGDGAWNMAVDEALHQRANEPILRVYRWSEPTVTLGYFEKMADARRLRPGLPLMRRWTGGGMVDHGADWTYTLVIPIHHEWAGIGRAESYCAIHCIIREVIHSECGVALELARKATVEGEGCFARPVEGDLLLDGRKIAGAAQRRTRHALLHQGSIQRFPGLALQPLRLAEAFAGEISVIELSAAEKERAAELVSTRYGCREWLEKF